MDLKLNGKRALVTGSSGGIGRAIAVRLADEGAVVVIHGRDSNAIDETVAGIVDAGGAATGMAADLGSPEGSADLAAQAIRDLEGIDILVNNARDAWAGLGPRDPNRQRRGDEPFPTMPDYAATKAALVNLSVSLAKSLDRTGVTANTVSPGIVVTRGVDRFYRAAARERAWGESWHEIERHVLAEVLDNPCGRLGRPEEVAGAVALLASPRADYVNASNWRIDGGSTACVN